MLPHAGATLNALRSRFHTPLCQSPMRFPVRKILPAAFVRQKPSAYRLPQAEATASSQIPPDGGIPSSSLPRAKLHTPARLPYRNNTPLYFVPPHQFPSHFPGLSLPEIPFQTWYKKVHIQRETTVLPQSCQSIGSLHKSLLYTLLFPNRRSNN